MGWIILCDHNLAIRYEVEKYYMDFLTFDAALSGHIGEEMEWCLFDGSHSHDFAEWESAHWNIRGSVKWDGCINWSTNEDCAMHGCGPGHAKEMGDLFAAIYNLAKRHFDLLGDPAPVMPDNVIERPLP